MGAPGAGIRDMREAELGWMAAVEREVFGASAWSEALIRDDYAHGGRRYRVVERDGQLAAYAVYGFDGDAFHLMNVVVSPAWRGRGLGRALMADFLEEARRLGQREAWLEVAVTNEAALALYRAHGFEQVRLRPRYYQPEDVDAAVMRVLL